MALITVTKAIRSSFTVHPYIQVVSLTCRSSFIGYFECLLSDSKAPAIKASDNVYILPTGSYGDIPQPTVNTAVYANEVFLPEGSTINDINLTQLYKCLGTTAATETTYALTDNLTPKLLDQEKPKTKQAISIKLSALSFKYKFGLDPTPVYLVAKLKYIHLRGFLQAINTVISFSRKNTSLKVTRKLALEGFALTFTGVSTDSIGTILNRSNWVLSAEHASLVVLEPGSALKFVANQSYSFSSSSVVLNSLEGISKFTFAYEGIYVKNVAFFDIVTKVVDYTYYSYSGYGDSTSTTISKYTDPRLFRTPNQGWTMEFWMQPSQVTNKRDLISILSTSSVPAMSADPEFNFTNSDRLSYLVQDGKRLGISLTAPSIVNSATNTVLTGWYHPTQLEAGQWYHIVLEIYNNKANLAINGQFSPVSFKAITSSFWSFTVGGYTNAAYSSNFEGYIHDFSYVFGNYYKHQDFEVSTDSFRTRFNLDSYTLPEPAIFYKVYKLVVTSLTIKVYGQDTESLFLDGGNAGVAYPNYIDSGSASSNYDYLDTDTYIPTDKAIVTLLDQYIIKPSGTTLALGEKTSLPLDDQMYKRTALQVNSSAPTYFKDESQYDLPLTTGGIAPTYSTFSPLSGGTSMEFHKDINCWVGLNPEDVIPQHNPGGQFTLDFWVYFRSLDEAAELFGWVSDDHVYGQPYTPADYTPLTPTSNPAPGTLDTGGNQDMYDTNIETWWFAQFGFNLQSTDTLSYTQYKTISNPENIGLAFSQYPYLDQWALNINTQVYQIRQYKGGLTFFKNNSNQVWKPALQTWYHIAIVKNSPDVHTPVDLYVNGTLTASAKLLYPNTYKPYITDHQQLTSQKANVSENWRKGSENDYDAWIRPRAIRIGRNFDGYISQVRYTKGWVRYPNGNFSVDTNKALAWGAGDPLFSNVCSLFSSQKKATDGLEVGGAKFLFNRANGVNPAIITEDMHRTETDGSKLYFRNDILNPYGNQEPSLTFPADNRLRSYLYIADNIGEPDWGFQRNLDFCLEYWSRYDSLSTSLGRYVTFFKDDVPLTDELLVFYLPDIEWSTPPATYNYGVYYDRVDNQLYFRFYNTVTLQDEVSTAPYTLNSQQWYHIALVRQGAVMTLYINGTAAISKSLPSSTYSLMLAAKLYIHRMGIVEGPQAWAGNTLWQDSVVVSMYEFRYTLGAARYTGNFAPPTSELPSGPGHYSLT